MAHVKHRLPTVNQADLQKALFPVLLSVSTKSPSTFEQWSVSIRACLAASFDRVELRCQPDHKDMPNIACPRAFQAHHLSCVEHDPFVHSQEQSLGVVELWNSPLF